jgi:hypothetical protein
MKRKSDRHRENARERERERGRWILIRRDGWPRDISRRCKSLRHGRTSVRSPSPTQRPCGGAAAANPLRTSFIQTWRLPALLCVDLLYFQCCSIELSKIFLKKKRKQKSFPLFFFLLGPANEIFIATYSVWPLVFSSGVLLRCGLFLSFVPFRKLFLYFYFFRLKGIFSITLKKGRRIDWERKGKAGLSSAIVNEHQ